MRQTRNSTGYVWHFCPFAWTKLNNHLLIGIPSCSHDGSKASTSLERVGSCIFASTVRARSIMPFSIMQALTKLLSVDWNKAYNERPRWNSSKLCSLQTPERSQRSPDTEHYNSFLEQGINKTSPVLRTGHPALSLCCNPCGRSTGKLEATKSNSISLTPPLEGGCDYQQWKNSTKIGEP